ncbi:hypothetical protein N7457_006710 [Penicillium paradoxum]|uniref:uncharacterized protein n=1 Tax=Penicillium paradoxum TaxID=176176 RepID=UPI0025485036|nr:uncharacterized protein N7457_006710 [Penicillium paradoxum]KAJ5778990.1 hypothetical protein N7457_006710 [Penicillium paradoxum]
MANTIHERIISLVKDGNLTDLIPAIETAIQQHHLPSTAILQAAIQTMQLEVLEYLLPRLFPHDETGRKTPLANLDRIVILDSLSPERVPAFKLLFRHDPSLCTMYLGHMGPPLAWAVLGNNFPLVSFLLANGADPTQCQINHRPAVAVVAAIGSCDMMELLVDHGAALKGTGVLFAAVRNHRTDMIALLVEKRKLVDINAVQPVGQERGLSPGPVLHLAIRRRDERMTRLLQQRFHADPMAKDSDGKTAVDWAMEIKDEGILDICLGGREKSKD